jgi:hypothetical protein
MGRADDILEAEHGWDPDDQPLTHSWWAGMGVSLTNQEELHLFDLYGDWTRKSSYSFKTIQAMPSKDWIEFWTWMRTQHDPTSQALYKKLRTNGPR